MVLHIPIIAIMFSVIIIISSHCLINNEKNGKQKKGSKEYDPKTPFVQAIPQPNLKDKYQPIPCNWNEMYFITSFSPFHKDKSIDASFMSHVFLPDSLIHK